MAGRKQKAVMSALVGLGGEASARAIAGEVHIDANHAADVLKSLSGVLKVSGSGANSVWCLANTNPASVACFMSGISP